MVMIRALSQCNLAQVTQAWNEAFSNYAVNLQLTEDQFVLMLGRKQLLPSCSFVAFVENQPAGFVLSAVTHRSAQIGYWLGKDYQGRGIMTRAVIALVEYGFNRMGLNRVEIHAAVQNEKSRSMPEKLGFLNEGCIRQAEWLYDHYVDHMVYGMLAEEWKG